MSRLQYLLLLSIAAFAFYPAEETELFLVSIMVTYATIFYYYVTAVMMTIKQISFDWESGLSEMWQFRFIMGMAMLIMYMQGYIEVFYYILPFFVIGIIGDIFSTLLLLGYIELGESKDPPDE
jgi:hypothetical protein